MTDTMTPAQRALALSKNEPVDRLPCNPNVANGVARVYGCKISEFNTNPKMLAMAQIESYRRFGYDSIRIFTDLFPLAEAAGATVIRPDDNTVDLLQPAISNINDIDQIAPVDPLKDGRLPIQLDAMKYLVDEMKDEISCSFGVVGAFTNACFLMGVEKTLICLRKNPEAVHKLCAISLESVKKFTKEGMKLGLTPTISEPLSSCTVISPKFFREFSLPYLQELIDFIKSYGKTPIIHICGQTDKIWSDLADIGIAGMSIDNVASIEDCKTSIGNQTKILGNVDPASVMYSGTLNDVRLSTLQCMKEGYDSPKGYIVMSGCSLPVDTPLENIQQMMDTVREVGYPVDIEKVNWLIQQCQTNVL